MKYGREIMKSFSGRVKSADSIYAKLVRKELSLDRKQPEKAK